MEKFIKENWFKVSILGLLVIFLVTINYSGVWSKEFLANKAKCAQDGANWVSKNFQENPPYNVITKKNFAYNSKLETCLVNIESMTDTALSYSIFDIYSNKEISGYMLYDPKFGLPNSPDDQKEYITALNKYFPK